MNGKIYAKIAYSLLMFASAVGHCMVKLALWLNPSVGIYGTRASVSGKAVILASIAFFLYTVFAPIGLSNQENYTPTDTTQNLLWVLSGSLFIVGMALEFLPSGKK